MIIKVCGMRDTENIKALQALDVDWMGLIFFEKSSRNVAQLETIDTRTPRVGVFVNEDLATIFMKIKKYDLTIIQLHGEEKPAFCEALKQSPFGEKGKIIKVFSAHQEFDFERTKPYEKYCDYFLFDTKGKKRGGNGVAFDWSILKKYEGQLPFILSGGINEKSANAIQNIQHPKFWGIDINSRFEIAPAFKNINKIKQFVYELRNR